MSQDKKKYLFPTPFCHLPPPSLPLPLDAVVVAAVVVAAVTAT
jgi:hypothetical protein